MHLKDLSMSYGTQELFKDVNLYIDDNDKVGVVGVNGSGKTTLFKIMLKKLEPSRGKIIFENNKRIEWLPQVISEEIHSRNIKVLDYLFLGRPIEKINNELQETYEKLSNEKDAVNQKYLFNNIDKLQNKLKYWDYYNAETTLLKIIDGMNINSELLDKKVIDLSGGEKSKVAFAKLLYSKPEFMLLDEPTNHLDKESKEFVIKYLKGYQGGVFIISHDIEFLNQIVNKVLFLDKRTKSFKLYNGNYDNFKRLNAEYEQNIINQAKIQRQEEEKLAVIINKYASSSGKRKRMVQDREKKLERLLKEKIDINLNEKETVFDMKVNRNSSKEPLKVSNLYFKYDKESDINIIDDLSFSLEKDEKFLIVGQNGIGKSTLLKLIMGRLTPDDGKIEIGSKTDFGYYAQELDLFDEDKTIMENFNDVNKSQKELRGILGKFLFFEDDVFKKIKVLSPGEKSRVALAKLSLTGANFLVLDEPTNHLDPQTQEIIAKTFKTFPGTMLVVSHNLEFVDNLGIDRILVLPSGRILNYNKEVVEYFQKINEERKN